jgi:hypothetical protein
MGQENQSYWQLSSAFAAALAIALVEVGHVLTERRTAAIMMPI